MKTLADLSPGNESVIKEFLDPDLALKLIELGCLPGEKIFFEKTAPFGCPIVVIVGKNKLCLRKNEACAIVVD
jgi:ferrous iron transport protein A